MNKKAEQLGMNPGTASHRLVKDLLFMFVTQGGYNCSRCNGPMEREDFSIDHIEPWLDSKNPKELYFDLDNVAFSHLTCNIRAGRRGTVRKYNDENELTEAKYSQNKNWRDKVCPDTGLTNRQLRYRNTGK